MYFLRTSYFFDRPTRFHMAAKGFGKTRTYASLIEFVLSLMELACIMSGTEHTDRKSVV